MRLIPRHHDEIHLPPFAWAERHRTSTLPPIRLAGYRINSRLEVSPLWEVRHDR